MSDTKTRGRVDHSRDDIRSRARAKRASLSGPRDLLTPGVDLDPKLHYCWVNDDDKGSVLKYQDRGYEFVLSNAAVGETTPDRPTNATESVVWKNMGNGVVGFLMAIPKEFYEEDMAAAKREREEFQRAQYNQNSTFDGSYNPQGKVGGAVLEIESGRK